MSTWRSRRCLTEPQWRRVLLALWALLLLFAFFS
jgi:hypothetical protein